MFAPGASDDGWQQVAGRASVAAMPDGTAYGWQDGRVTQGREITLSFERFHGTVTRTPVVPAE